MADASAASMPVGTLIGAFYRNGPGMTDFVVETILLLLAYGTTGLRVWSRKLQRAKLQLSDYLIFIACFLMSARYALEMTVIMKCGLGLHITEVVATAGPGILVLFPQLVYVVDLLWVTLVTLIKVSILHFYYSVFRTTPFFVIVVHILMGLCGAFWCGAFFATAFFCDPPTKQWLPATPGHCGDSNKLYAGVALSDLIIDIMIIAAPMPLLWSLQLRKAKKVALTFIFGLGFVIISITSIRIKFMFELDVSDPTFGFSTIALLSAMVPLLGIINANLPLMAPAFKKIFNSTSLATTMKKSYASTTGNSTNHGQFERVAEPELPLVEVRAMQDKVNSDKYSTDTEHIRVHTQWEVHSSDVEAGYDAYGRRLPPRENYTRENYPHAR